MSKSTANTATSPKLWLGSLVLLGLLLLSLFVGQYPIRWSDLQEQNSTAWMILWNLRLARGLMAICAGFSLSFAGYVYQALLQNPIASPDVIGVSSGACAGAGIAIVCFGGSSATTTAFAFLGAILAVLFTWMLALSSPSPRITNLLLAGIAVNAMAQAVLMILKRLASPETQLASLEYWTMGSFSDITLSKVLGIAPFVLGSSLGLILLFHHITVLSFHSDMATMLGAKVKMLRCLLLFLATIAVASVVSVTGLISFIGLMAPHMARNLYKTQCKSTLLLSGILGSILLLASDMLARSLFTSEVPLSVVTSFLGVPFLLSIMKKGGYHG